MDNHLAQAGSNRPRSAGVLTRFAVVSKILEWLTTLFLLSDEQQEQAGVYLSRRNRL